MKLFVTAFLITCFPCILFSQVNSQKDISRWEKSARQVTIIRDNWGIPHVYGKTDADAVFGLMYAQCEDDFNRVELNYIEKLGRLAMLNGESAIYNDLYIKLVIDEDEARKDFANSPAWLQKLLIAFADGINYYLYKHPSVKPKLLNHFEPYYPLLWTDGSIGAISTGYLSSNDVKNFYTGTQETGSIKRNSIFENTTGSNGFAIAGSNSASGNAMLYINPHVTLYFRPEVHMVSDEGLNAYGAVTWGQFFIYQGFNEYNGWMHTSSDVDVSDLYLEKITKKDGSIFYEYDGKLKPVTEKKYQIEYKTETRMEKKSITTYATHHGPIMSQQNNQWISVRSNNRSMTGLIQSWQRTKTKGFEDYQKLMELRANTSNNTVYADHKGNIAYWHGNFIPKRDVKYNWAGPVDGSTPATEWKGLHTVDESVHVYNPAGGWIQNCNSTPFTAAGVDSPKKQDYARYLAPDGENFRGVNALRIFSNQKKLSLDQLIGAGYDRYLSAFEKLVPALITAYENESKNEAFKSLAEPMGVMKEWDLRCGEQSIATTLAIEWGQQLAKLMTSSGDKDDYQYVDQIERTERFLKTVKDQDLLTVFTNTIASLNSIHGNWRLPWGQINRFQRTSGDVTLSYSDDKPSLAVGYASSAWGMLASYGSRTFSGTKLRYCYGGNSFVCAVEFGTKIKAKSLLAGGESGNPLSRHFNDQAEMYAKGIFKDVLFYKEDVVKHAEKTYHPGDE